MRSITEGLEINKKNHICYLKHNKKYHYEKIDANTLPKATIPLMHKLNSRLLSINKMNRQ